MPASHTALLYEVKTINKIQFTERPREGYFSEHFVVPTPITDELTRCNRSGSSCSHGRWGCPLFWWVLKDLQVRKRIHNILSFSAFSLNSCQLPNAVPGTLRLFFLKRHLLVITTISFTTLFPLFCIYSTTQSSLDSFVIFLKWLIQTTIISILFCCLNW